MFVCGNPPWGTPVGTTQRTHLKKKSPDVADFESSQYFLIAALDLVGAYGTVAMIGPNTLVLNVHAKRFRERPLTRKSIAVMADLVSLVGVLLELCQNGIPHDVIFDPLPVAPEGLAAIASMTGGQPQLRADRFYRRCSRIAPADSNLLSGSFAIILMIVRATRSVTAGFTVRGSGTGDCAWARSIRAAVSPS